MRRKVLSGELVLPGCIYLLNSGRGDNGSDAEKCGDEVCTEAERCIANHYCS